MYMLGWWYGQGWAWAVRQIGVEIQKVGKIFAVSILLKTLFAPWKQITTVSTFQNFFQSLADNTVSRAIGFIIRFWILMAALVWTAVITVFGIVVAIIWPLLPLMVIILPILFFLGVGA